MHATVGFLNTTEVWCNYELRPLATHTHHHCVRTDAHCNPLVSLPLQVEIQVRVISLVGLDGNVEGALCALTPQRLGEDQSVVLRGSSLQEGAMVVIHISPAVALVDCADLASVLAATKMQSQCQHKIGNLLPHPAVDLTVQ